MTATEEPNPAPHRWLGPRKLVILVAVIMLLLTGALYGVALLRPEYLGRGTASKLQMNFVRFLLIVMMVVGVILIPLIHRAYNSNFQRLRVTLFSVWAGSLAISIPLIITPVLSLISACVLNTYQPVDCKNLDYMEIIPEILITFAAPVGGSFAMAVKFAFLYGWYLLGRDLFDIYRGRTPAPKAPVMETPEPPPAVPKLSRPRAQFGFRNS